jgi:transcriptional regulator with XRE-family HTH domain
VKLLPIVAQNLLYFRKQAKLTQESLAIKAGFHPNYIGRVERGEDNISINSLEKLAKVMRVDPFMLLLPNAERLEVILTAKLQ